MKAILLAACLFSYADVCLAECSSEMDAKILNLRNSFQELKRQTKKITARVEGQVLRQNELEARFVEALPVVPKKPILPEEYFDNNDKPIIVCGTDGSEEIYYTPGQAEFMKITALQKKAYENGQNDQHRSSARAKRRQLFSEFFDESTVINWVGSIESLSTNREGKGVLEISIASNVSVTTYSDAQSDLSSGTLIEMDSPVYQKVMNLSVGDKVSFAGSFLESDQDYFTENSLLERDTMTTPRFIFKFSSILDYSNKIDQISASLAAFEQEVQVYSEEVNSREAKVSLAEQASEDASSFLLKKLDDEPNQTNPVAEIPADVKGAAAEGVTVEDGGNGAESEKAPSAAVASNTREPLLDSDNGNIFRRVLSLPKTMLYTEANKEGAAKELPTFSILYVFDETEKNGHTWLEVGSSLRIGVSGWVVSDETLAWSSMLVMGFAPRGSRNQVLFFKDHNALSDMVNSPYFSGEAAKLFEEIQVEREQQGLNADYKPVWPSALVAMEPQTAVTFDNQPYLLPILDWREEAFDGVDETVLLQVAAVPADAVKITARDSESFANSAKDAAEKDGEFRVGITFVLDTTVSMGPFIERTYQAVEEFYKAFQQFETARNVSFGLIGFRDSIAHNPNGLEYVTRVFQPLDTEVDPKTIIAKARLMSEAKVPTKGFKEDSYAGIAAAINDMDWQPFDARLVILVTDASAREGGDPLAAIASINAKSLVDSARRNNVAIVAVHLQTPANQSEMDNVIAEHQYRELSRTGDTSYDKYIAVDATSDQEFGSELQILSETIAKAVFTASSGQLINEIEIMEPIPEPKKTSKGRLASAVKNEIFRAQLESLATVGEGDAPSFLAGWTADKDLMDPSRRALDVSVFLTRNQLSSLDKRLDAIIDAFRSGGDDPKQFFKKLQFLAAEISIDPEKTIPEGGDIVRSILPSFLANLPYRSQVLRLDLEYWSSISVANRQEFIENLEAKTGIYQEIFDQTDNWVNFGADDPGFETTPVPLINLP